MKYRHRVLGLLLLLSVITYVDRVCISVAGRTIQDELGLTPSQWGWILGAFALSYGLLEIPAGVMADRIGPRRVLTRIVIWWSGFTALTGAATGFWSLLTTRFCFGAGEAGAYPSASAAIARWFPSIERGRAQGAVWMASRIGGAISPMLVVPLQLYIGWRLTFVVFGLVGAVWALVWFSCFRDDPGTVPGISGAEMAELGDQRIVNSAHGLDIRSVLANPNIRWIMAMYYFYCWCGFFYLSWLHTYLERARGFSKADLVAWSWLPFALGACATLVGGSLSDRLVRSFGLKWGRRSVGLFGLLASAVFLLLALLTADKFLTILFLAFAYAATDLMLPVAWAVCLDIGGRYAGTVSAAMNMAGQAGSFSMSVAFGYIVTATGSYDAPLVLIAVLTAGSAVIWLKIDATEAVTECQPRLAD